MVVNICVTTKNITFTSVISYLCVYLQFQIQNSCCFVKNWSIKNISKHDRKSCCPRVKSIYNVALASFKQQLKGGKAKTEVVGKILWLSF